MDLRDANPAELSTLFAEVVHFSNSLAKALLTRNFSDLSENAQERLLQARESSKTMPATIQSMQSLYELNAQKAAALAQEKEELGDLEITTPPPPLDPMPFKVAMLSVTMLVQQSTDILTQPELRALYKDAIAKTAAEEQELMAAFKAPHTPLSEKSRLLMLRGAKGQQLAAILALCP